ncbi:MAG TPA: PD-(D/E)XK nuclease family protein [Candidatus Paceibacterota bacterium]
MSKYYNPKRSAKYIFDPKSQDPYRLSRSKVDLFIQCPRCFYLDQRHGVGRPPGFPMTLNNAVDALLKKEFDIHRANGTPHPLMRKYKIDAVPFQHEKIDEWRDALRRGVSFLHKPSNLILRGGIDDVWVSPKGELMIVDYKATSKDEEITLDDAWKIQYKRQMEIYQWLFEKNGFRVSKTGYFVYVNGKTNRKAFDGKLEFDVTIIPYTGDSKWVEKALLDMKKCLLDDRIPKQSVDCDYCNYVRVLGDSLRENLATHSSRKVTKKEVHNKKPSDDKEYAGGLFS